MKRPVRDAISILTRCPSKSWFHVTEADASSAISRSFLSETIHIFWLTRLEGGEEEAPHCLEGTGGTGAVSLRGEGAGRGGGAGSIDEMIGFFKRLKTSTGDGGSVGGEEGGEGRGGSGEREGGGERAEGRAGREGREGREEREEREGMERERGGSKVAEQPAVKAVISSQPPVARAVNAVVSSQPPVARAINCRYTEGDVVEAMLRTAMAGESGQVPRGLDLALDDLKAMGGDWFAEDSPDLMTQETMRGGVFGGGGGGEGGWVTGLQAVRGVVEEALHVLEANSSR